MKRIAVVGSGISGLAAAYLLSRRHEVHLFEKAPALGGHTHTVVVERSEGPIALDTGFLVHNDRTYPLLVRLFEEIGIETLESDMCFSVRSLKTGLEYSSRGARGFFAQRRNILSPSHLSLLREILRFNRAAAAAVQTASAEETIGEFLDGQRFSAGFANRYLYPMASAIWSASLASIREFPLATLVRFLDNHGLLAVNGQPKWRVVRGGSHTYIPKLTAPLGDRVHLTASIQRIDRGDRDVTIAFVDRPALRFDEVVLACHGDQVLPMLRDASAAERALFSQFETTTNDAWLHTDTSVLPTLADAHASWNYLLGDDAAPPTVTYHLNRLQSLTTREQFCVTLNPGAAVDPRLVLKRMTYRHPLYTRAAVRAQQRWADVSGRNRTHFCGAYWFYGFHEDGLRSAVRVAQALGVTW